MYKNYSELGSQPDPNRDVYSVLEVQNGQHKSNIINQNRIVIVDVYADWCGPCKQTAPQYASLANTYNKQGQCILVKENLDKKLTRVEGVPTFQFYMEGRQVDQVVGADLQEVEKKLQNLLQSGGSIQQPTMINQPGMTGPNYRKNTIRQSGSPYQGQQQYNQSTQQPQQSYSGNEPVYNQPYQNNNVTYH